MTIQTSGKEFLRIRGQTLIAEKVADLFLAGESFVYLIHMEQKIGRSQHYIGSTDDLETRLKKHSYKRKSGGSALLREANKRGIPWRVERLWKANRRFEFVLKRQKHAARYCPACQGVPF